MAFAGIDEIRLRTGDLTGWSCYADAPPMRRH
jgi:hypothetical protein